MKETTITAKMRPDRRKGPARRTRQEGYIPGVVYGPETQPFGVAIEQREFHAAMKAVEGTSIINLDVEGQKTKVVIREIQRDPITSNVIHLDFHAISMNKPINVSVPIRFIGTPVGVKTDGGIMQVTMRELAVSCLPADIPEHVEVDVTDLHIGDSVHVQDLSIPGTRIVSEPQRTVVVIAAPTVMKVEVTAEEEEAEAAEAAAAEEEALAESEAAQSEEEAPKEKEKEKEM